MELEVYNLRNELIGRVDNALNEMTASNEKTLDDVKNKLEKIELNLEENKTNIDTVHIQLAVIVDQTKSSGCMDEETVKQLANDISKAALDKYNIASIEEKILEVKESVDKLNCVDILESNKKLLIKLDEPYQV